MFKMNSGRNGQNGKWSKWNVDKIKSGDRCSKCIVVKMKSG